MSTKIIDRVEPSKPKKPIELVACLQDRPAMNFYKSNSPYRIPASVINVERVVDNIIITNNNFDMIVVEYATGGKCIFLGHWNDGILPEQD